MRNRFFQVFCALLTSAGAAMAQNDPGSWSESRPGGQKTVARAAGDHPNWQLDRSDASSVEMMRPVPAVPSGATVDWSACFQDDKPVVRGQCCDLELTPLFYVRGEYLMWWVKNAPVPVPLVTTGSTANAVPGALGQPNTAVLSPSSIDLGRFSGGRATVGGWFSENRIFGFEASGFALETKTNGFQVSNNANGNPLLAVPFFDTTTQAENAIAGAPGFTRAAALIGVSNRLWGADASVLFNLFNEPLFTFDTYTGFMYLNLSESLNFRTASYPVPAGPALLSTVDTFNTRNQFYGGLMGFRAEYRPLCWLYVALLGKTGLGDMHQTATVSGASSGTMVGGPFSTGIFTQGSNVGQRTRDEFAIVSLTTAQVGVEPASYVRIFAGYDFLYANTVLRPGDQIDRAINPTQFFGGQLVGAARPQPLFQSTYFWAQGVNVGLELRY